MKDNLLDKFPVLAKRLGRKGRASVEAHSRLVTVPAGTTLVRHGAPQEALYLLVEGGCEVSVDHGDASTDLGRLLPGEWVGKQCFFDHAHTGCATVVTDRETRLIEIRHDDFEALQRDDIEAAGALVRVLIAAMAARIRATNELLEQAGARVDAERDAPAAPRDATHQRQLLASALSSLSGSRREAP